jgi:hypothetical protein
MVKPDSSAFVDSPAASRALILRGEQTTPEDQNLARLLDFFSIPWKVLEPGDRDVDDHPGNYAIISSADCMAAVMQCTQELGAGLPAWISKASSVYVYGFRDDERSTKLLRFLTGNPQATVKAILASVAVMTVTGDRPEMCGPMSGMRVPATLSAPGCVFELGVEVFQSVVRTDEGEVFGGVACAGVRFYLNAWSRIIDISALSAEYFDVKKSFCETVPLIFFLKWAFRGTVWHQGETSACLIVDDPPLKRRYGFLDFREALDLMRRHNFTTTIAFIPWNWHRTHPRTLGLFQSHPKHFSVVVHGCDHTSGEFAERSTALLNRKTQTSTQRMEQFQQRAAIQSDRVMVFPQGRFSPETPRVLKLNGFAAAVNTEVAPAERAANETTIADLWNVAIMRYGTSPIFTRRYPNHGIENFAFDGLLGKPCLIAAHHDVFRDHARNLVDLVTRLNSLRWNLVWRPLGEALRHSFTVRHLDDGTTVVRMFAGSLLLDNPDAVTRKTLLLKEEGDRDCVQAVLVNGAPVEFSVEDGYMRARLTALPGEKTAVGVVYRNTLESIPHQDGSRTRIKVAAKRYLSEFRDNYLSRNEFIYQSAHRLKHLMK